MNRRFFYLFFRLEGVEIAILTWRFSTFYKNPLRYFKKTPSELDVLVKIILVFQPRAKVLRFSRQSAFAPRKGEGGLLPYRVFHH